MYRINEDERYIVYFYGFDEDDIRYKYFANFFYFKTKKLETFNEIFKHSGYSLVLNMDIDNIRKFDIKYRNKLKYSHVIICNEHIRKSRFNKFSNIVLLNQENAEDLDILLSNYDEEDFEFFVPKKFQHNKLNQLYHIHEFVKGKKSFNSLDVASEFNISVRNAERYLQDINYIYNDIGYDYAKNEYYTCE